MAIAVAGASRGVPPQARELLLDTVTGLPNAERLTEDLSLAFAAAEEDRSILYLFVLKGLKKYNEAYGELCGDALLGWLARRLRVAAGDVGVVYRMRGASFAVLASGSERLTAELRAACLSALREVGQWPSKTSNNRSSFTRLGLPRPRTRPHTSTRLVGTIQGCGPSWISEAGSMSNWSSVCAIRRRPSAARTSTV